MNLNLQIYIDTSGSPLNATPTYERLDLFDFEMVELTSTIQDVRDIAKIFTDYTQEFSIPASKNNNKIFKHFYNNSIVDGFDARIKQRGLIYLNGIKFKGGLIRLSEGVLTNSKADLYKITFFGDMVSLKEVLGDRELKDLIGLQKYNHPYNNDIVYDGFKTGLGLNGSGVMVESTDRDIVYPAISPDNYWYYDGTLANIGDETEFNQGLSINIASDSPPTGSFGINYTELKPAIKVRNIINAIEETYVSIDFSDDFFSTVDFEQLYMPLHNNKGFLSANGIPDSVALTREFAIGTQDSTSDFNFSSGLYELRPLTTSPAISFLLSLSIATVVPSTEDDIKYTVELLDGGTVINSALCEDVENFVFSTTLPNTSASTVFRNLTYRITTESISSLQTFDMSLDITRLSNVGGDTVTSVYSIGQQSMINEIIITNHLPKIKILDFLTGLFRMFNLTAYIEDGIIVVKPLNNFYQDGGTIDLTDEIDNLEIGIKRSELYSQINFDFNKPKTFGIINQNEVTNSDFGNLEFDSTEGGTSSLAFDGKSYNVKLPFEKVYYERIGNVAGAIGQKTQFAYGWLVDKDQNATLTQPILFFNRPTVMSTLAYKFGFKGKSEYITNYNRPSNVSSNSFLSTHFSVENDEYTGNPVTNSLFSRYYQDYVSNMYDVKTRLITLKGILKLGTLFNYNMNDTVIIRNKEYRINSIKTTLNTGETELELLTNFDINTFVTPPVGTGGTPPTTPTNVSWNNLNGYDQLQWTKSTAEAGIAGYEVFLDDGAGGALTSRGIQVLYDPPSPVWSPTKLTSGLTYRFQVRAVDLSTPTLYSPLAPTTPLTFVAQ